MNIKLHTPKSLKMGSGLSTLKQFLMSIVATSISIALTFGTAHVVDNYKKQKEKREMVMMLMYDMDQTMEAVNDCESEILAFYEAQVSLLANPDQFMAKQYDLYAHIPEFNYTQTTENIFKSSIETISTISNVLFVESVSEFYNLRQKFKSRVVDYMNEEAEPCFGNYDKLANLNTVVTIIGCRGSKLHLQKQYDMCKSLMHITDKDIEVFAQKRKALEKNYLNTEDVRKQQKDYINEMEEKKQRLDEAVVEGRKKMK